MKKKKRILFVEDEADFRCAVRMRLEAGGYEVIEAEDGVTALDIARNQHPDLLLLDLRLPRMDGYRVVRLLKSDEKCKKIPIVILTASSQAGDSEKSLALGADVYLTKPYKPQELLETIARLLSE